MRPDFLALLVVAGCTASIEDARPPDPSDDPPFENDTPEIIPPAESHVYDLDHVIEVDITMADADWAALRTQARPIGELWAGEDCMDQPFGSPYSWFSATVTVDGTTLEDVGIRKKGFFGSVEPERPSLKLEFDEYVDGQRWEGVERLTLNNNRQDPSRIRTCLGYSLFADAGMPASRCNFAHVTVNGEDLGVYSNVEPLKPPMLRRVFGSDDGALYEGTISDFREGWLGTFDPKTEGADGSELRRVAEVLMLPDDQLVDGLDAVIDVDQFIEFWVMESLIGHWDGYAGNRNNFFVYADPSDGRLRFVPWGIDAILTGDRPFGRMDPSAPAGVVANSTLPYRAVRNPELTGRFVAEMRHKLDTLWDEQKLEARRREMRELTEPYHLPHNQYEQTMAAVSAFIERRQAQVEQELDTGWARPPGQWREFNNCQVETMRVTARFDTTWNSTQEGPPWSRGEGSIQLQEDKVPVNVKFLGATAGPRLSDQIVAISGELDSGAQIMFIATARSETALTETGEHAANGTDFNVFMTRDENGGHDSYRFIGALTGTVTLEQIGNDPGDPVVGVLDVAQFARRQ